VKVGIRVAAVRGSPSQLMRTAEAAHRPGMTRALQVITLVYSASITMSRNIKVHTQVLTGIAAALAFLIGGEIGIDFVIGSPGSIASWGRDFMPEESCQIQQKRSP
jgi:hypothetical protein